jgi:PAS domain S-box-containing protein
MAKRAIKSFVAAALLAVLIYRADWNDIYRQLTELSSGVFLGALALLVVGLVISTWKWLYALRMQGLTYPFGWLLRVLCIGFFLNNFLPTSVGGDAYRVYRTLPRDGYRSRALAAVALERFVGLLALLCFGAIGALNLLGQFVLAQLYCLTLLAVLVAGAVLYVIIRRDWLVGMLGRWRHSAMIDALVHSVGRLRNQRSNWIALMILSMAFQVISIAVVVLLFREVTGSVALAQAALITAVIGVAAALPISINGIGVVEGAFTAAAVALGMNFEQALLVALARRVLVVVLSIGCGAVYVFDQQRADAQPGGLSFMGALRSFWPWRNPQNGLAPAAAMATAMNRNSAAPMLDASSSRTDSPMDRDLFEYTDDAIIIWEMDGKGIVYWNRAAERLYGYRRNEALGKTTHVLLNTQLTGGVEQLESKLGSHGMWLGLLNHTTRSGHQIQVDARLALMSQCNGRWLVLEVNRDVTDQQRAQAVQAEMERQLNELRRRFPLNTTA